MKLMDVYWDHRDNCAVLQFVNAIDEVIRFGIYQGEEMEGLKAIMIALNSGRYDSVKGNWDDCQKINRPSETSIAYGQTKEQANEQVQEQGREEAGKVEPTQFKVRFPFIK